MVPVRDDARRSRRLRQSLSAIDQFVRRTSRGCAAFLSSSGKKSSEPRGGIRCQGGAVVEATARLGEEASPNEGAIDRPMKPRMVSSIFRIWRSFPRSHGEAMTRERATARRATKICSPARRSRGSVGQHRSSKHHGQGHPPRRIRRRRNCLPAFFRESRAAGYDHGPQTAGWPLRLRLSGADRANRKPTQWQRTIAKRLDGTVPQLDCAAVLHPCGGVHVGLTRWPRSQPASTEAAKNRHAARCPGLGAGATCLLPFRHGDAAPEHPVIALGQCAHRSARCGLAQAGTRIHGTSPTMGGGGNAPRLQHDPPRRCAEPS
jgi:hypothetical protein